MTIDYIKEMLAKEPENGLNYLLGHILLDYENTQKLIEKEKDKYLLYSKWRSKSVEDIKLVFKNI